VPLHVDRRDRVAILMLDDPDRRNALSAELVAEIVDTVDALEADEDVGALVVTGAPPAFCSGADVGSLGRISDRSGDGGGATESRELPSIYDGFLRFHRCPLPVFAAVNGPAVGAGLNLALACDVRIASPDARFDARFARIGLHPGGGHTRLLVEAVGRQAAAAMDLAGVAVDGERAVTIGLAWECVPAGELVDRTAELAARAAEVPRPLAEKVKASLRETPLLASLDDAVALELERQQWSFQQGYFAEAARRRAAR
jgi:enoyl-CoA hydratase